MGGVEEEMNYNGAFECDNCPRNNDPQGGRACPAWWEVIETNTETKQERVTKACGFTLIPRFLTEVIAASNRPSAAIESFRNEHLNRMDSAIAILASKAIQSRRRSIEQNGTI